MNSVSLIGRLTKDPDVNTYGKGRDKKLVARYTLAVDGYGDNTDFISCVCFGKTADFADEYLFKGMKVGVSGRITTGSYENDKGDKVYTTDVVVDSHTFCEKKNTK